MVRPRDARLFRMEQPVVLFSKFAPVGHLEVCSSVIAKGGQAKGGCASANPHQSVCAAAQTRRDQDCRCDGLEAQPRARRVLQSIWNRG